MSTQDKPPPQRPNPGTKFSGYHRASQPDRRVSQGFKRAKKMSADFDFSPIDGRSQIGRFIRRWTREIEEALGGPEMVTPQQRTIIELAAKTRLLVETADYYLFTSEGGIVNKGKRQLHPVVRERQALADSLAKYMTTLGLQRVKPEPKPLDELLATIERDEDTKATKPNGGSDGG